MTVTQIHTLPQVAGAAALASIASAIETLAMGWDGIFSNETATITSGATTTAPTATGLCQVTTTEGVDEVYTYCDCGTAYASTLPLMTSTTAPCDYTELPRICRHGASPQQGKEWCNCEGYPHTLPTLTTENNQCGYTSFPDPWPYTATDADGNILGCETSTVEASTTECAGDHYTISAAPTPTATPRCVTAHTTMDNCMLYGDIMSIQLWENGVQICKTGKNIDMASSETEYDMDCGDDGASVMVTDNGARLVYKSSDGWQSEIAKVDGQHYTEVCGYLERASGVTVDIKGFQYEYVFDNGECGNCNTAGLCDYNSPCPNFDGSCS